MAETRKEMLLPWVAVGYTTRVTLYYPDDLKGQLPAGAREELTDYHPGVGPKWKVETALEDPSDDNTSLKIHVSGSWAGHAKDVMESLRLIPAAPGSGRKVLIALPRDDAKTTVWWDLHAIRLQAMSPNYKDALEKLAKEEGVVRESDITVGNELILTWRPRPDKRGTFEEGKIPDEYYYTCWKW